MKKCTSFSVVVFLIFFSVLLAQEPKSSPEMGLVLVEKPAPVPEKMKTGFASILGKNLKSLLVFISSDLLEGRETAGKGYDIACEYAASLFSLWGLKPAGDFTRPAMPQRMAFSMEMVKSAERSYFQDIPLREIKDSKSKIVLFSSQSSVTRTKEFTQDVDFTCRTTSGGDLKAPVAFAGYGISEKEIGYDDYKKINAMGKWVLLLSDAPGKTNPNSPFQKNAKLKEKYFSPPMFMRGGSGFNKIAHAEKMGAVGVLMVRNPLSTENEFPKRILDMQKIRDDQPIIPRDTRQYSLYSSSAQRMPWEPLPTIYISPEMANEILAGQKIEDLAKGIENTLKPASFELANTWIELSTRMETALARSQNVLCLIEGSDPQLKNEVVVVGAHFDHLGKRGDYIFNGADDNGSGSVAVMTLAQAFAANHVKPRRSLLFALWTGEEKGLLGSRYYVDHPYFPLDKTVANVNIDMLSRPSDPKMLERMSQMLNLNLKSEIQKKIRFDRFITIFHSSDAPKLAEAIKQANQYCGYDIFLRETGITGAGGGSDHASFGMKKVPWATLLSSTGDDYHKPTDSIDKVNSDYMEKMNRLLYLITYLLADQ